jgi:RNA polymerase sigma factor (TIGR02999 family)
VSFRGGPPDSDVTGLLVRWSAGDPHALEQVIPLVYGELRRIASNQLRRERKDHTLAPTALVNELYLRLVDQRRTSWQNRVHFFGLAAQLMRRILVDHARARSAEKRGGGVARISIEEVMDEVLDGDERPDDNGVADVLAVDEALERLASIDAEQARIVELRFFGGLSVDEIAAVVGRSPSTVKREWRLARAWLFRALRG